MTSDHPTLRTIDAELEARADLLSETARQALGLHIETKPAGSHALPGLEGSYPMFRV